jgi:4-hydroxy-tetrahydrodipicolinate synthase
MSTESTKSALRGVGFTIPTPFSEDGDQVRHDAIRQHVGSLSETGARLFVPCGNTGEYYALTNEERIGVVEATVEAADREASVVAGLGGSTKTAKFLASEYQRAGADAVMIMHPGHTYMSEAGLLDYYREIVEATDLDVVIYKRGPEVTKDILVELSGINNVVGIKYAVNDVDAFSDVVRSATDDVVWITGVAERFAPSFALEGAEGFTTGLGNFLPEPSLELQEAIADEDWERALQIRDALRPIEELRDETDDSPVFGSAKNVPVVKCGMELCGFYGGPVRNPLRSLSTSDRDRLEGLIERANAIPTESRL